MCLCLLGGAACLDDQLDGRLQGDIVLVVLLQQVGRALVPCADGGRLPAAVVAAGVALVQLELPLLVPADRECDGVG